MIERNDEIEIESQLPVEADPELELKIDEGEIAREINKMIDRAKAAGASNEFVEKLTI